MKRRLLCKKLKMFMCLALTLAQIAYVGDAVLGETIASNQEETEKVSSLEYEAIDISEDTTEDVSTGILCNTDSEIMAAYEEICEYIENNELQISASLDDFVESYQTGNYDSVESCKLDWLNELSQIQPMDNIEDSANEASISSTSSSSDSSYYYYNTGSTLYEKPKYTKYNLLTVVEKSDIVYDAEGGSGVTGHIAIVEGIYYSAKYGQYYIRVIESIGYAGSIGCGDGVCRGILDDERVDERGSEIVRVTGATSTEISGAVSFCRNQIGKDYVLGAYHRTSSSATGWYCSELVWAAYYNQGIDLESSRAGFVLPSELLNSSKVSSVSLNSIGVPTITYIAADSQTSVTINWSVVPSATKYYVYRATSVSGTYSLIRVTTSNSYTNTGLSSNTNYYYRIAAYNTSGRGNMSIVRAVSTGFKTPVITRCCETSDESVYLAWSAVYNATGYYVYRSTSASGTYTKIKTTTAKTLSDSTVTSGNTYYYKIVAYNSSSSTEYSSNCSAAPGVVKKPTIYYANADSELEVTIKWTHIPNATKYYVYRSTSATGTYTHVGTVSKTVYEDSLLLSGKTYYYRIRAYESGNYSAYSSYKAVTTN